MLFSAAIITALSAGTALAAPSALDSYIASERKTAAKLVVGNIGPNPARTARGVVLAGPGVLNPDYRYSWTRDSALTAHMLEEEIFVGNSSLKKTFEDYIYAEANRQTVYNSLGPLYPWGTGLGDAKYWPNLTRYNGVWGRPQRDGPALRAITLMTWIEYLLAKGDVDNAKNTVWPIVQNDLNYVAQYWGQVGYDLWEEVAGISFFTIQSQWRALNQGSRLARELGLRCIPCEAQAPVLSCYLAANFWNETGKYVIANIAEPNPNGRSGIDNAALLGAIENFDITGTCDNSEYQPCSDRILATHKTYVDSFRTIYPINAQYKANSAIATGRYPEDTYYSGNPWYLCTLAAAEVLYDAAAQFRYQGKLAISSLTLSFFKQFYPSARVGTYTAPRGFNSGSNGYKYGESQYGEKTWGSPSAYSGPQSDFTDILSAMTTYADGFVKVVQQYGSANGSFSEQYNRTTGQPLSAYDLTWSLASFVTMAQRRSGQFPASWNSTANVPATAGTCSTRGYQRTNYTAAVRAGAPATDTSCTVQVLLYVNATTTFGQNIYVTGNVSALGNYEPGYEPMVPPEYPIWRAIFQVKPDTVLNYKYVYQNSASYALEARNRTLRVGPCGDGKRRVYSRDVIRETGPVITTGFCDPDRTRCEDVSYLS